MSEAQTAAAPAATEAPAAPVAPAEAPKADAKPAEAPKVNREADKWADVTERERAARSRSERLKAEAKALAEQKAQVEQERATFEAIKKAKATGDFSKLEELLGPDTYEAWTRTKLKGGKPDPVKVLKAEIHAEMEAKAKAEREAAEAKAKADEEAKRTEYYSKLDTGFASLIKGGADKYELTALEMARNPERIKAVLRYADANAHKPDFMADKRDSQGRLTLEIVAATLESELAEEAERLLSTSKFKSRLAPSAPVTATQTDKSKTTAPQTEAGKDQRASGGPTTLTERLSQEKSSSAPVVDPSSMTDEELSKASPTVRIREQKRRQDEALARAIAEAEAARDRRAASRG